MADLAIWAYIQGGNEQDRKRLEISAKGTTVAIAKLEYLADNRKEKTGQIVSDIKSYLFDNDLESVKEVLTGLLDKAFAPEGYVIKNARRIMTLLSGN